MIIYVSHEYGGWPLNIERAKTIVNLIQKTDTDNCYICPVIAFSHLDYKELSDKVYMELCIDVLSVSDKLLVIGTRISDEMQKEINYAKLFNMPILYLNIKPKQFNRMLFLRLIGKKPDISRFPISVTITEKQ